MFFWSLDCCTNKILIKRNVGYKVRCPCWWILSLRHELRMPQPQQQRPLSACPRLADLLIIPQLKPSVGSFSSGQSDYIQHVGLFKNGVPLQLVGFPMFNCGISTWMVTVGTTMAMDKSWCASRGNHLAREAHHKS